ncbi:protein-disulfide reductase DsbD family protein [Bdellovibrio sp. HCB337]|uniref:protein-disulfide reductase DsbD family protein n=1 Tax=Bdellovibrio sp. HCB337 TaxID=3394358 RepID=UPI0039A68214
MTKQFFSVFFSVTLLLSFWPATFVQAQSPEDNPDPLLTEVSLTLYEWNPGQSGDIEIKLKLPKGYHAYEDMFRLTLLDPDGFKMSAFKLKPVHEFYDKFSKKNRRGVEERGTMSAHIEAPLSFTKSHSKLVLELTYQACSDTFCLFPVTKKLETPIKLIGAPVEPVLQPAEDKVSQPISKNIFSADYFAEMLNRGGFIIFVLAFFAGILTSFTPCIFPMIPITLAVLGNDSNKRSRAQNFLVSCIYVLGIATTYSILGLVAATTGTLFGASLGNPYVLSIICFVFLAMALSMYGLYDIQVPAWMRQQFGGKVEIRNQHLKTYLTGLFAGIVASPCVGPVLVTILAYVATHQNKVLGFFLLFTYALGLGLIFLALGLSNQLIRMLPRSGMWMNGVKFVLGSLMLSAFYYYLDLLIPTRAFDAALGLGLVVIASIYGAFKPVKNASGALLKGLMVTLLLVGLGYISFGVFDLRPLVSQRHISEGGVTKDQKLGWQPFSEELLQKAAAEKRPVIIDFWAEWCAACHELEQFTFTNPLVRTESEKFILLKFDATKDSPELRRLKQKYKIQGLPTVIFYNPAGTWIESLTLTRFEESPSFLSRMKKAQE